LKAPSKTTRSERRIATIADVEGIEQSAYADLVPATSVLELFMATAALHGDRPAFTLIRSADPQDVEIRLTHREMLASILQAANLFASLGIGESDVVALVTKTYGSVPSLIWGAETAGVASCLNYLLAPETLAALLRKEEAKVLVCPGPALDPDLWEKVSGLVDQVPSLRVVLVIGGGAPADARFVDLERALAAQPSDRWVAPRAITRDTLAALFHTGGTTGVPKLVPQAHGHQIHAAWSMAQSLGTTEQDVILNGLPLFHVGGLFAWGLAPLAAGAHMIAVTPVGYRDAQAVKNIWAIVEHYGVTLFGAVPTTIGVMVDAPLEGRDLSTLRLVLTGGAGISAAVADRFERRLGVPLIEQYGMTEAATAITCTAVHGNRRRGQVGIRHPYSQIRIVESTEAAPLVDCPAGTRGALICKGRQVVTSYVDPRQNEGAFTRDGWLITGDVGYLTEDQQLVLTGRQKDLIIRSGHNIDPASIEDAANAHPDVAASAAVGMPDAYAGEVPVIFVVPRVGASLDLAELATYIEKRIPEPPAKPRHIFVVPALPLTAVGKIFKPTLREQAVVEKLKLEIRKLDAGVEIAGIRFEGDATGDRIARIDLVKDSSSLAPDMVELRLTEALRDLTVEAAISWH
jgi:fatty-acyl-CoA synthase